MFKTHRFNRKVFLRLAIFITIIVFILTAAVPMQTSGAYYLPTTVSCGGNVTLENIRTEGKTFIADLVVDVPPEFQFLHFSETNVASGTSNSGNISVALTFAVGQEILINRYIEGQIRMECLLPQGIKGYSDFEFKNIKIK